MKTYRRMVRKRVVAALRLQARPKKLEEEPQIVVDAFDELAAEQIDLDQQETA
ncbi:MAG: hypothetical protein KJO07_14440 [Deltaproteobacteria bacterium]|jgi:hypothetical protein|nr:hypothetical protein [Deltaproteobacteria bacterium]